MPVVFWAFQQILFTKLDECSYSWADNYASIYKANTVFPNITSNFKNKQNTKTKSRFNSLKKRRVLCEIKGWEL